VQGLPILPRRPLLSCSNMNFHPQPFPCIKVVFRSAHATSPRQIAFLLNYFSFQPSTSFRFFPHLDSYHFSSTGASTQVSRSALHTLARRGSVRADPSK
jgi:hypothetical protein